LKNKANPVSPSAQFILSAAEWTGTSLFSPQASLGGQDLPELILIQAHRLIGAAVTAIYRNALAAKLIGQFIGLIDDGGGCFFA